MSTFALVIKTNDLLRGDYPANPVCRFCFVVHTLSNDEYNECSKKINPVKMNIYIWLNKIFNHILSYVYLYIFCHNYIWHCVGWQFDDRSVWLKYYICFTVFRRRQDGGLFHPSPYVGYPFFMIPDLGNFCSPYLSNGALAPNARTVSIFTV